MNASNKLQLTYQELQQIVNQDFDNNRFKVLYDDIPKEGHSSNYIMDDGRQYRYFEFVDLENSKTYNFSYTYHPDWSTDFPLSFVSNPPDGIEFVKESVINKTQEVSPPIEKPLTPEELADKQLLKQYINLGMSTKLSRDIKKNVPRTVVKDAVNFLKNEKFSKLSLRAKMFPICIKYKVDDQAFWTHLQEEAGHWKKAKRKPKVA